MTVAQAAKPVSAKFTEPTNRYPHNALGNLPGFGGLEVTLKDNSIVRLTVPLNTVFEDIAPRLWDINADGIAEIVAVQSHQKLGARLTVWQIEIAAKRPATLELRAATEYIGTRFRWLAPLGFADFTGDGKLDIAYVEAPHVRRQLVLVQLQGSRLVEVDRLGGFSNHRIGDEFITGGVRACQNNAEILLPTANWNRVARVTLKAGKLVATHAGVFANRKALHNQLGCNN